MAIHPYMPICQAVSERMSAFNAALFFAFDLIAIQ